MKKINVAILFISMMGLSRYAYVDTGILDDLNTTKHYTISFLNNNLERHHRAQVSVRGYVRHGHDGRHVDCYISSSEHIDLNVEEVIWLEARSCYEKNHEYIEGYADVVGTLYGNQEEVYISGGLYKSYIDVDRIDWVGN